MAFSNKNFQEKPTGLSSRATFADFSKISSDRNNSIIQNDTNFDCFDIYNTLEQDEKIKQLSNDHLTIKSKSKSNIVSLRDWNASTYSMTKTHNGSFRRASYQPTSALATALTQSTTPRSCRSSSVQFNSGSAVGGSNLLHVSNKLGRRNSRQSLNRNHTDGGKNLSQTNFSSKMLDRSNLI